MTQAAPQALSRAPDQSAQEACRAYDIPMIVCVLLLLGLGLVMVASASMPLAERALGEPWYYFRRQFIAAGIGIALAFTTTKIPLVLWQRSGPLLILLTLVLLVLVLLPGLGKQVNGSMRWIGLGPISLQASEPAKLCLIIYLAGYLVRRHEEIRTAFSGFAKPIAVLTVVAALLLLEPDYGSAVVLFATALGMMYLAGVPVARFVSWGLVAVSALGAIAVLAPYRLQRLMTFVDPWADPQNSGYQLTQALIAVGRGEWFGVGLGSSIQKLFYLPEVHTDFMFAVVAEELGLMGAVTVICLFAFFVWRAFWIGGCAERAGQTFSAYLAYGLGLLFGIQAFVNMGVNMGMLPTKGLTLPLMSYGSNSMVITGAAIGMLLRVEHESRSRNHRGVGGGLDPGEGQR